MSRIGLLPAFTILAAALVAPASAQDEDIAIPAVTIAEAKIEQVQEIVSFAGTVKPRKEVFVTPQVNAVQIRQVLADVGDRVERRQVVIRLDRRTMEAQLAQAEAQLTRARAAISQAQSQITSAEAQRVQAESELVRARQLRENGTLSQAAFDQLQAGFDTAQASAASARDGLAIAEAERAQAEAQLSLAELNLDWTEITAPTDGIVTARNADIGALTSLGAAPLLTIVENGSLEIRAEVIETALGGIAPGDPVDIDVAGIGPLIGFVRSVAPSVNEVTRLGWVMITPQGNAALREGLFASGQIVIDRRDAVTVPITAVLSGESGAYVQVVADGTVTSRPVVPGLVWNGQREIVSGLEDGIRVIARAGAFFRDGDRVREVEK